MMILDKCPYCGKKITIGTLQCPFCGEDLSNLEPPKPNHYQQYRKLPMPGMMEAFKTCFIKKYANFHGRARRSEYWWFDLVYYIISLLAGVLFFCFVDFKEYLDFSINHSAYEVRESIEMLKKSFLYNPGYWLSIIISLGFLIPNLAVTVRRLHDIGKSGTLLLYFLFGLIPLLGAIFILVYAIILLVWMCTDGHKEPNKWGPSPKYIPVNEINTGNNA